MKIHIVILTLVLSIIGTIKTYSQSNVVDEVVWMVGDEPILKSDIEYQKLRLLSEGGIVDSNYECVIPENIAIQKLFLNQAKIDSVTVDETQVNRYVDRWVQNAISQVGSKEKLEEYFGKKLSQIRSEERKEARNGEIVRAMQQKIVQGIQVSPSEIRAFYATLPTDSIPFVPETVEIQIISLKPTVGLKEIDRIKNLLRGFVDQVKSGHKDFSTLARLYSEDKKTSIQGGEYGYVSKSDLEENFANAVFGLSKNRPLSDVVKTDFGYHIVQLLDKKNDMVNFRHILIKPQIADSAITSAINALDSISEDIKSKKLTFGEAASYYSDDDNTRNNNGLMTNKNFNSQFNGSPNFQYQDLSQDVAKEVHSLKEGDISKPFIMHTDNGGEEVAIVKLKAINAGHKANLNYDYTLIKDLALSNKRAKKIDEWILEKQKSTFIEINKKYQNCKFKYPNWIHENN